MLRDHVHILKPALEGVRPVDAARPGDGGGQVECRCRLANDMGTRHAQRDALVVRDSILIGQLVQHTRDSVIQESTSRPPPNFGLTNQLLCVRVFFEYLGAKPW